MANKVAVIAVHGMGSFTPPAPGKKGKGKYSAGLAGLVRKEIDKARYDANVHWREVYYGNIMEKNQAALMKRLGKSVTIDWVREFVVNNLGDPASYAARWDDANNTVYRNVHDTVDQALKAARKEVGADAPVVLLAHSLGAKVVSNHIWDSQGSAAPSEYDKADTIAQLITFGCNLPIFTFAFDFKDVAAIKNPGTALKAKFAQKPWWRNFYDRDDALGFPLALCGKGHADLATAGELVDQQISVGGLFSGWNVMSHTKYWEDPDFARPVAAAIRALIDA